MSPVKDRRQDRHDRETTIDIDAHTGDDTAHVGGRFNVGTVQIPIPSPHELPINPFLVWKFAASRFPNGVTVTDCGFVLSAASDGYTVAFLKYTSPTDGTPVTIESVTASGADQEPEDNGTIDNPDIAVDDLLFLDLPATEINEVHAWITFTIL